jgi:hypothetical protein
MSKSEGWFSLVSMFEFQSRHAAAGLGPWEQVAAFGMSSIWSLRRIRQRLDEEEVQDLIAMST